MRMNIKYLVLLIISLVVCGENSYAWELNHTYVDPDLINNAYHCTPPGPVPSTPFGPVNENDDCCKAVECAPGATNPETGLCYHQICSQPSTTRSQAHTTQPFTIPRVNETCFHPTCYSRVIAGLKYHPMPVQPLTNSTAVIKEVVTHLTDGNVGGTMGTAFKFDTGLKLDPTGSTNYILGVSYPKLLGTGTGTSAMQGLLWSWRMLSVNWIGVWGRRSDYEQPGDLNIIARQRTLPMADTVPSPDNSKNIIIISDGIDSDGPDYKKPDGSSIPHIQAKPGQDDATASFTDKQSLGFSRPDEHTIEELFDTCDAHVPLKSIVYSDYINDPAGGGTNDPSKPLGICNRIAAQGIKIYVVLYAYTNQDRANSPLVQCAHLSGGDDISAKPEDIVAKMKTLVASIVVRNIRLIK